MYDYENYRERLCIWYGFKRPDTKLTFDSLKLIYRAMTTKYPPILESSISGEEFFIFTHPTLEDEVRRTNEKATYEEVLLIPTRPFYVWEKEKDK